MLLSNFSGLKMLAHSENTVKLMVSDSVCLGSAMRPFEFVLELGCSMVP